MKEKVYFTISRYLGMGISLPDFYYGYVKENTDRGTSIVEVKYKLGSVVMYKKVGFFKRIKEKWLPMYFKQDWTNECKSTKLKRVDDNFKHIKKSIPEYAKEIKKYQKDGWKIKECR